MTLDIEPWYQAARPDLVEAVARAVADRSVADDAVDEAFARAVARWDQVVTLRSPNGWVYTVAVNAARRTFRRRNIEAHLASSHAPTSLGRSRSTPSPYSSMDCRHGNGWPFNCATARDSPRPRSPIGWTSDAARFPRPCERLIARLRRNSVREKKEMT